MNVEVTGKAMSEIEQEVVRAFDQGPSSLADLGGPDFVLGREHALARVSLMPEVLAMVLPLVSADADAMTFRTFILACIEIPVGEAQEQVGPSTFQDVVGLMAAADLPPGLARDCQRVFVRRLADPGEQEAARWIAMGGALNLALRHPSLRHQLLAAVVDFQPDEVPPEFARRLAKVAGVVNTHWPDTGMYDLLGRLCSVPVARDEALFELGMARLGRGLDAETFQVADAEFEEAKSLFEGAVGAREHRPDAVAYATALSMLTSLRRGDGDDVIRLKAAVVTREVDVSRLWGRSDESAYIWTSHREAELARWSLLATRVGAIREQVATLSSSDAEVGLRQDLLGTYLANRVVMCRGPGGVETVLQPAIKARLLRDASIQGMVRNWLQAEADPASPMHEAASSLIASVREWGPPPGNWVGAVPVVLAPLPTPEPRAR